MEEELSSPEYLVRGKGMYVDDIRLPNMLHMAVLRSPYPRAKILSVKGGLNGNELKGGVESVGEGATASASETEEPIFGTTSVNYAGQPVAAVFADDLYKAQDLLESVEVDYEPLKPVMGIEEALSMPPIYSSLQTNIMSDKWRGKEFELENAPVVLEDRFFNRRVATNPIEPRGLVASSDGSKLTIWISTQSAHSIKEGIVGSLRLKPENVRVIQADTGGGFGLKGGMYTEYLIAAYAAMKYKRPVKWIETRREHMMASRPGRGVVGKMKLFADRAGKVLGVKGEVIVEGGAFSGGMGEFASNFIAMQVTGPYQIENAHVRAMSVFTNKVPMGPYRGAGRPEAAFFMERMMDLLADDLKMDPAELRLRNATTGPFKSPTGLEFEASKPFMEKALREMDYASKSKAGNAGLACFVLVPAYQPGESCRIVVKDKKIRVWLGGNSHGQAHDVFAKKLISEELGVDVKDIEFERGDTDMLEDGVGAWGSRTAIVGGAAIVSVARKIKDQIEKEFGKYSPELLLSNQFDVYNFEKQKGSMNSLGANLATVELDSLGSVSVKEIDFYYDIGRPLNMDAVRGQIIGGAIQGMGQTLSEEIAYSQDGQLLTASIADAGVQTAEHIPRFDIRLADSRSVLPHGAKGLGEAPTIGVPSALVRAIERVSGKRVRETPVKAEMLLGLVK